MSVERFATIVGESTSRRGFLKRLGVGALGVVAGVMGTNTSTASAYSIHCCGLCASPNQTCHPYCSWCWTRCDGGRKYLCCEGYAYSAGDCTNGNCGNGWYCSYYVDTGQSCSPNSC